MKKVCKSDLNYPKGKIQWTDENPWAEINGGTEIYSPWNEDIGQWVCIWLLRVSIKHGTHWKDKEAAVIKIKT